MPKRSVDLVLPLRDCSDGLNRVQVTHKIRFVNGFGHGVVQIMHRAKSMFVEEDAVILLELRCQERLMPSVRLARIG